MKRKIKICALFLLCALGFCCRVIFFISDVTWNFPQLKYRHIRKGNNDSSQQISFSSDIRVE